jgi:hypothetical protein
MAGITEPLEMSTTRQHVPAATNTQATIVEVLETVFSVGSALRLYKKDPRPAEWITRVEAGSNTSTVTLRVVRGDEKGSLKSETVKYGQVPRD